MHGATSNPDSTPTALPCHPYTLLFSGNQIACVLLRCGDVPCRGASVLTEKRALCRQKLFYLVANLES